MASTDLKTSLKKFHRTVGADSKAVNSLLHSHNLRNLDPEEIDKLWTSLFYALWYAEMGRGCEDIIASIDMACHRNYKLTRAGFLTISRMWHGLDQYRIDKVSHLARHLLPRILEQQIRLWLKTGKGVRCKLLLKRVLDDVLDSYGLCYFVLEILADEISKTLISIYDQVGITTGKFELKADLIVFLYGQVIAFAANVNLDARLLRTFDQHVIKKFVNEILPNEPQLTQILVSLRLYQKLDSQKKPLSGKCSALFKRWSEILQDIHERCINGEYFPSNILPRAQ